MFISNNLSSKYSKNKRVSRKRKHDEADDADAEHLPKPVTLRYIHSIWLN